MRKPELKKLKDNRIAQHAEAIRTEFDANGCSEALIDLLVELRQVFIELEQPSIVKSIRLACEHIDKYGDFVLRYWGNDAIDDEYQSNKYTEDLSDTMGPSFLYYLDLLSNPSNKYNRDEIKEINLLLKDSIDQDYLGETEEETEEDYDQSED